MEYDYLQKIENYLKSTEQLDSNFEKGKDRTKNSGCQLPLGQHVRGLVYSKLSQQTKWDGVLSKSKAIDDLFFDFDVARIRETPSEYFYNGLCKLGVGRFRESLADNLHYNIDVLESTLVKYECGSCKYILTLAKGLKGLSTALVCEYLSYVNIDRIKPDLHIKRFLKRYYGRAKEYSDVDVLEFGENASSATKYNLTQIDALIWSYCAKAQICSATPKCEHCCVKESCKNSR